MSEKIELLAPGGDVDAIKAAIIAGADAVYCGLDTFNARNRAANISFEQLVGIITLAHQYQCKVFLTLNIVILEHEFKSLTVLLNKLANTALDGVIVQDLGLLYVIQKHFPTLDIHASTQLTTHNIGQIPFLKKLGASRVNLSRELNLREITAITETAKAQNVLTEVFVHGSLCVAFSGLCYSTSASVGNSGNRGRCSQACREEYETTPSGNNFPLNLKDNSAFFDLPKLIEAGVHSFKVEGRIKGASYVHTVIDSFRKQIDGFIETGNLLEDGERLYKVFNRDFSNAFLRGDLNQSMFIENPRDNSKFHAIDKSNAISVVQIQTVEDKLKVDKDQLSATTFDKIKHLSIEKPLLSLVFTGSANEPLTLNVTVEEAENNALKISVKNDKESHQTFTTEALFNKNQQKPLDKNDIIKRFKTFDNNQYTLNKLDLDGIEEGLSIPFKALTSLKIELATFLNHGKEVLPEVKLPKLTRHAKSSTHESTLTEPKLSILIADEADLTLCAETDATIYFKLPDSYKRGCTKYVKYFNENPRLIPWFPSVLIGKDYDVAVNILEQVKPQLIVTNNTGIAHKAYELGIEWIAGPFLNTTNSYALLAMKEHFNCHGAFISNEINQQQMKTIAPPENFKLFYSVYHPILLMTSRQCFFQQSVGCEKPRIDNGCMLSCDKSTSITNLKGVSFSIDKQKGGYPSIYNNDQFLNTDIINELNSLYDGFMIDLTNVGFGDKTPPDKIDLISQFSQLLDANSHDDHESKVNPHQRLHNMITESTNQQYYKGL